MRAYQAEVQKRELEFGRIILEEAKQKAQIAKTHREQDQQQCQAEVDKCKIASEAEVKITTAQEDTKAKIAAENRKVRIEEEKTKQKMAEMVLTLANRNFSNEQFSTQVALILNLLATDPQKKKTRTTDVL